MLNAKPNQTALPVTWEARVRADGTDAFRVGRSGKSLVAEWPGIGRLTCRPGGTHSQFLPEPGADRAKVTKLRAGAVRALLGDIRGGLSFHGSAVGLAGRAVLVLGPSGAGKSTAAGELCLRHRGHLLADDMTSLDVDADGVCVVPTERHHYLAAPSLRMLGVRKGRSRGAKTLLPALRISRSPVPLALVVIVRRDGRLCEPRARALKGGEAVKALSRCVVRFDVLGQRRRELDQLFAVYDHCKVLEIARPTREAPQSLIGRLVMQLMEEQGPS
jgi:hypothetical protein